MYYSPFLHTILINYFRFWVSILLSDIRFLRSFFFRSFPLSPYLPLLEAGREVGRQADGQTDGQTGVEASVAFWMRRNWVDSHATPPRHHASL